MCARHVPCSKMRDPLDTRALRLVAAPVRGWVGGGVCNARAAFSRSYKEVRTKSIHESLYCDVACRVLTWNKGTGMRIVKIELYLQRGIRAVLVRRAVLSCWWRGCASASLGTFTTLSVLPGCTSCTCSRPLCFISASNTPIWRMVLSGA